MSMYVTDLFSDIHAYDISPVRKRKGAVLILSFDEAFKKKAIEENCRTACIGFRENAFDEVQDFAGYFKFFMSVLPEVGKILIDEKCYSLAISLIHSSALNIENVKEVILYVDESDPKELAFYPKDPALSSVTNNKEKTYSRRQFLDGGDSRQENAKN